MRVAFFINTSIYNGKTDFRNLHRGNPGIGGTEYIMLLVAQNLYLRNNDLDIGIFVTNKCIFDDNIDYQIVSSLSDALIISDRDNFDRFVFDHKLYHWFSDSNYVINSKMKLIPWCHTFALPEESQAMAKHPNIGRIIAVGSEQCDLYRDDKSFELTDYIFNCVPVQYYNEQLSLCTPYEKREHIVTYIGSLIEGKTFHVLARLWPRLILHVPDAQLYVIGSGAIYGDNNLGPHGLASVEYESRFMPFLTDKNGDILKSVHFMGAMGVEKNEVLLKTKVGVPNPTGKSETFCISAVEMQAMGCAVTAIKAPGYFDTIYNGFLADDEDDLVKKIVKLLNNEVPKSQIETISYIKSRFAIDAVMSDWERLLKGNLKEHIRPIKPLKNIFYRRKWLKEIIRYLKLLFPYLHRFHFTVEGNYQKHIINTDYKLRG